MSLDLTQRLNALTQHSYDAEQKFGDWNQGDPVGHLSEAKKSGWKKLISSLATTEEIEQIFVAEIEKAFQDQPSVLSYLESHTRDEIRHRKQLTQYLLNTFRYTKSKRTFTDKWIYDTIFPYVSKFFAGKPVYGLALVLFFESYGVYFYRNFKKQAEQDGLTEFTLLLEQIEKDELRHLAGVKALLSMDASRVSFLDQIAVRGILLIAVFDLNLSLLAWYNRKARKSVQRVGLSPDEMTSETYRTAQFVLDVVTRKEALC